MINMKSTNNILPKEEHINNDHLLKAYKIGSSKCQLDYFTHLIEECINPNCLTDIKNFRVNEVSNHKVREANTFVGLNNLGATCYVNSLLQLWFHNTNIRTAILNWDPMYDEIEKKNPTLFIKNEYIPDTEIGNLQLVFALMQFGNQPTINPENFINSLKINIHIQEDTEEFQNYLVTLLHQKLNSQSNVSVREMIKDNFFGECNSVTKCLNCKTESVTSSQFREIPLNIESHKTLTDCLQEYFKIENMIGNEKYFCTKCNNKQNAVRQSLLTSLPHLVHLKLMRYEYNNILKRTTKLNTEIRCPYTLDMGKYLDSSYKSSKQSHIYNLYGVLIHRGTRTNVGHFYTHIKDLKTEEWYEMDDENVKIVSTNNSNLKKENIFKGLTSTKSINIQANEYKTDNAYMLVYISASLVMKQKAEESIWTLPPQITEIVNNRNDNLRNTSLREIENIKYSLFISKLIREIKYSKVNKDEGDAISLKWITSMSERHSGEKVNKINNESIVCSHNKLNPNKLYMTKYIETGLADKLYSLFEGGPRLKLNSSLCEVCLKNRSALLCMNNLTNEHQELISWIQKFASTNNNSDDKNNAETFWLGIKSFECWQTEYLKMFQNFLKFNNILPNATFPINQEELVATCTSLIGILDETLVKEGIKENNIESDDMTNFNNSEYNFEDNMREYFENLETQRTEVILKSDIHINRLDRIFNDYDTKHVPWTLNEDITCPHGNLCIAKEAMILVPEDVRNIFKKYYPKVQLFAKNTKLCRLCKSHYKNIYSPKMILTMDALLQEKFVNTLMFDDTRPSSTQENLPYFCISKDFFESWLKFVTCRAPKPLMINNKSLLCKDHNELLFEPTSNFVTTDQSVSVIITKNEWLNLIDYYQADYGVFVYFDKNGIFQKSIPKVCQTCIKTLGKEESQFNNNYIDAKIFIQVIDFEDQNLTSGKCSKKFKRDTTVSVNSTTGSDTASTSKNTNNHASQPGIRRSERKQMPKVKSVMVSFDSSLLHLKLKIMEVFHVKPENQNLKTSDGIELLNNEATMEDLKILPDSVILAQFDEQVKHKPEIVIAEETGFKGTELMS